MRAALGLALAFGGGALALYVLSGRVPLSGATSAPVSGGTAQNAAQTGSSQAEPINQLATNAASTALGGLFGGAGGMP